MRARDKAGSVAEPRRDRRRTDTKWRTALTCIEPNKILVRGYPLDEVMGRLTFGEAIYLLFMGEVPSPGIGRLMEAILVSFIDHGATPPSTLAARNTATTGAATRACVAAGLLGFGNPSAGGSSAPTTPIRQRLILNGGNGGATPCRSAIVASNTLS